jgi:transcriptional regulator with XRE-family HTH domain
MSADDVGDEPSPPDNFPAFGEYLRMQRRLARLTLRELAELTSVSNPYLSQIERGLHQPSIIVVKALADALNLSAEALLSQAAGLADSPRSPPDVETEAAIRGDPRLTLGQKAALLAVYESMVDEVTTPPTQKRSRGEARAAESLGPPRKPRRTSPAKKGDR